MQSTYSNTHSLSSTSNQQHKHKDKRRNAKSQVQPNAHKTTQSQKPTTASKAPTATSLVHRPSASTSSSSDSDDPYSSRQYSKRTIVKNWDKYSNADAGVDAAAVANAELDCEQMSAADFGQLLRAPAAEGAHFRFSSERSWDADESATDLFGTQFFRMNVSQMERQLLAVPFHERQQYAAELFTDDELQHMRAEARAHNGVPGGLRRSEPKLSGVQMNDVQQAERKIKTTEGLAVVSLPAEEVAVASKEVDDELDTLLSLVSVNKQTTMLEKREVRPVAVESVETGAVQLAVLKPAAPVDDLQQWLDDILDDWIERFYAQI